MHATTTPLLLLLATALQAQVQPGDIAVTGFSTTSFGVIRGTTVTGYTTPGFQGTGTATSQAILWDPVRPNDFVIGGFGFLGRATITGPGTVSYALITPNVGTVVQMSWDDRGRIVFVDSAVDQVRRLDLVTATVTDLSTGSQPWGTDASSGAWDPGTGDVVVGGNGGIWRLTNGSSVAVPVVTGLGGFVSAIAFDPLGGEILATVLTVNRFIRVGAGAVVTDMSPPGSVPGPNALDVDEAGRFVTGGGTGQVYRVPYGGGAPAFLASNTSPANAVNGLSVANGGGVGVPYGLACNGAGGAAALFAASPFRLGVPIQTTSVNHEPGALGAMILGLSRTANQGQPLPFLLDPLLGTAGCSLYCSIDAAVVGFATWNDPGSLQFAFTVPPVFPGLLVYVQHVCFEPVAGGLSWSNGLAVQAR
jgi:hypothetical protein